MKYPPKYILKYDGILSDEARMRIRDSIERTWNSPDGADKIMVLEEGMSLEAVPQHGPGVLEIGNCKNCGAPVVATVCAYCGGIA